MPTTAPMTLNALAANLQSTLNECANSGRPIVIELPDHRLVAIQPLDPAEDDDLIDELLASNGAFQSLLERSAASSRKPFVAASDP